jgi:integrase
MKVEDWRPRGAGWSVRLHENAASTAQCLATTHLLKPCTGTSARLGSPKTGKAGCFGRLFRAARGPAKVLSDNSMTQPDAWRMIRRRAAAAGIAEAVGCHTFRATGITAYLMNGDALEHTQEMAAHESPRTTKLSDRTRSRVTQDEIERIRF